MEAKELINNLMIGDWIKCTDPTPMQITTIDSWSMGVEDQEGYRVEIGDLQPIPLTEEILLKNDFIWHENIEGWVHRAYPKLEVGVKKKIEKDRIFAWVSSCFQRIEYVHELQHLMRLCGLGELADKLKIE